MKQEEELLKKLSDFSSEGRASCKFSVLLQPVLQAISCPALERETEKD